MKYAQNISLLAVLLIACGPATEEPEPEPPAETWLELREAGERPPGLLSEIGIFRDLEGSPADVDALEASLHPDAITYVPDWPLWSNGLQKSRQVVLPEGEVVGADDVYSFPSDTLYFKSFFDDRGPVETRVMWNGPEGWEWSAYVWDEERVDAARTEGRRSVDVDVEVGGESFTHKVPNELDCRKCHEPDPNGVLGFSPLQLGTQVEDLDVFDENPTAEPFAHPDPETEAVLGWLVGNCTSCHNGLQNHDQSSFDLNPDVALENTVGVETASSASIDGIRIVPGDAESSVLYAAVAGTSDDPELKLMPPVGVQKRDDEAIERLRVWIESMESQ